MPFILKLNVRGGDGFLKFPPSMADDFTLGQIDDLLGNVCSVIHDPFQAIDGDRADGGLEFSGILSQRPLPCDRFPRHSRSLYELGSRHDR
jgi:hypothetical protein